MKFETFIIQVQGDLQERLKNQEVLLKEVEKNNNQRKTGLLISDKKSNISPIFYLEEFYEDYLNGEEIESIVTTLATNYEEQKHLDVAKMELLKDYQQARKHLLVRLVNKELNKDLLKSMPYFEYLDLVLIFSVIVQAERGKTGTVLVSNSQLEEWQIDKETLREDALTCARERMPLEFLGMSEVLFQMCGIREETEEEVMYVLSNTSRSYGAAVILYPECLKMVSEHLNDDYYLLPSSIHEVIIVPKEKAVAEEELSNMVKEVNATQLDPEDILSDHAYFYSRSLQALQM
ncbi:hypothetical protein M2150_002182 [Lachnospiraceae bacterium PM6-15]|uniref:DUF5688 family protein n=1 Tax=Ohessyouella blattaphilus TaxID=2949333 RepID=UPI003E1B25B6